MVGVDQNQCRAAYDLYGYNYRATLTERGRKMHPICALITIAMQLACVVDREILCTDNESLAQLLSVPSCERVFSHHGGADVSPRDVGQLLAVVIADDEAGGLFFDRPRGREAAGRHFKTQ